MAQVQRCLRIAPLRRRRTRGLRGLGCAGPLANMRREARPRQASDAHGPKRIREGWRAAPAVAALAPSCHGLESSRVFQDGATALAIGPGSTEADPDGTIVGDEAAVGGHGPCLPRPG